jgi:bifunctional non-homologous end joining protein LigD
MSTRPSAFAFGPASPYLCCMSVTSELRRRVRADKSLPRHEPCLPRPAKQSPAGPGWIHEIKHDGFRIIAYRDGNSVRLMTRKGYDFADRFPLIADAVAALPVRSCVIDGEAIACDENGLSVFDLLHHQRRDQVVTLCALDLLSINGEDVRREPIEERKAELAKLLRRPPDGIALNEQFADDGAIIYRHACGLGCEGIVSKRLGSPYRAGRSAYWVKVKNPAAAR